MKTELQNILNTTRIYLADYENINKNILKNIKLCIKILTEKGYEVECVREIPHTGKKSQFQIELKNGALFDDAYASDKLNFLVDWAKSLNKVQKYQ